MIVAILNEKGGVGKTTSAVALADAARRASIRTLLIDLDSQGNVSDALGLEKAPGLFDLLVNGKSLVDVAIQARDNLWLVRSDKTTATAENVIAARDWKEHVLAAALEKHHFDLVILDCAPSSHVLHTAALIAADALVIPTALSSFSTLGVTEVEASLKRARRMAACHCVILGILPTRMNRAIDESHAQFANLADIYPDLVWPAIPTDARVEVAQRKGLTLHEFNPRMPALAGWKIGGQRVGGYDQVFNLFMSRLQSL